MAALGLRGRARTAWRLPPLGVRLCCAAAPRPRGLIWRQPARGLAKLSPDMQKKGGTLALFTQDLTARAKAGKLDSVIGRDEEIKRTLQVLSRRTKNNPVLIGEPGVGKTAVVEGLAQRIASRTAAPLPTCHHT